MNVAWCGCRSIWHRCEGEGSTLSKIDIIFFPLLSIFPFTEQIYLPVLHATQVLDILSLVLRILCEAWLDHIYTKKIKFR